MTSENENEVEPPAIQPQPEDDGLFKFDIGPGLDKGQFPLESEPGKVKK